MKEIMYLLTASTPPSFAPILLLSILVFWQFHQPIHIIDIVPRIVCSHTLSAQYKRPSFLLEGNKARLTDSHSRNPVPIQILLEAFQPTYPDGRYKMQLPGLLHS
jgi:hypothetical protein